MRFYISLCAKKRLRFAASVKNKYINEKVSFILKSLVAFKTFYQFSVAVFVESSQLILLSLSPRA